MVWTTENDRRCGNCSGIPDCCVEYFITVWKESHMGIKLPVLKELDKSENPGVHYIPCPTCLKNKNFIKLLPCNKECDLVKEFEMAV
jgi:hypothetical protein